MSEVLYDVPLDTSTIELQPPFVPKTAIFVNGSNVNITVTDEMGHTVTIGANDGGAIPVWPARHWRVVAAAGYTTGSAYIYFSDKRIPGSVGGLAAAAGAASGTDVTLHDHTTVTQWLAIDAAGRIGVNNFPAGFNVNNFPATQPISAAALPLPTGAALEAGHLASIDTEAGAISTNTAPLGGGAQANLWNGAVVGANGNSAAYRFVLERYGAVFGHASAATTMLLQFSQDNANFYTVNQAVLAAAGDFGFTNLIVPVGTYVRLQTTGAATITATAVGSN